MDCQINLSNLECLVGHFSTVLTYSTKEVLAISSCLIKKSHLLTFSSLEIMYYSYKCRELNILGVINLIAYSCNAFFLNI